jgi:ribonuclease J
MSETVKFIPIGGLNEVGANCLAIETDDLILFIDCGVKFPTSHFFNVSFLSADLSVIHANKPVYLLITHGHEDHIGNLQAFKSRFPNFTLYASRFTLELLKVKYSDYLPVDTQINTINNRPFKLSDFEITPFEVDHSIPGTLNFLINWRQYNYWHLTDFRFGEKTAHSLSLLKRHTLDKTNILSLDSTNVYGSNKNSEKDTYDHLNKVIDQYSTSFITLFASNLDRFQKILEISLKQDKKVFLLGRAIETYLEVALKSNYLSSDLLKNIRPIDDYSSYQNKIILVSGCQGSHRSALHQLSLGRHRGIEVKRGDAVIFSSKVIPGNEVKLATLYDRFTLKGAHIITDKDYSIHSSGHADLTEMESVFDLIGPQFLLPIHGNPYFTKGVFNHFVGKKSLQKIFWMQNNEYLLLHEHALKKMTFAQSKEMLAYNQFKQVFPKKAFKQRLDLAEFGIIVIALFPHEIKIEAMGIRVDTEELHNEINTLIRKIGKINKKTAVKIKDQLFKKFKINPIIKILSNNL